MSLRARALADSLARNAGKLVLATVTGLVLAGMTHVGAILLLPWLSEQDAYSRLSPTATADAAVLIAAPRGDAFADSDARATPLTWMPQHDPALAVGACAYDLADGPLRVSAPDGELFQTVSLHARGAGAYYAVTDRAAVRGRLELVIATQAQLDALVAREEEEEEEEEEAADGDERADGFGDLRVVAPTARGFVLARALAAFPSEAERAIALVEAVSCAIEPL